jgi:hypothetical protein
MSTHSFCSQYLRCPRCHGPLIDDGCTSCGEVFRNTLGILDLRWPRPSHADLREEKLIEEMLEQYESTSFLQLSELVSRHRFLSRFFRGFTGASS